MGNVGQLEHTEASNWAQVKWVRAKLTPSGADVAAMSDRNDACGQCCDDMENARITKVPCTFWRRSPGRTWAAEAVMV